MDGSWSGQENPDGEDSKQRVQGVWCQPTMLAGVLTTSLPPILLCTANSERDASNVACWVIAPPRALAGVAVQKTASPSTPKYGGRLIVICVRCLHLALAPALLPLEIGDGGWRVEHTRW
jgi:hypothetical protein